MGVIPLIPQTDPYYSVVHYTPHYLYAPSVPFDLKKLYPHSYEASQNEVYRGVEGPFGQGIVVILV